MKNKEITIDRTVVSVGEERNLLELCRKAGIELPTFCYNSDISIYGACRMCMVEVEGRGIVPACSTVAEDGMVVHTNTQQIRDMRKMIVELMLANHDSECTTCAKSGNCRLQSIAKQLGVDKVRFKHIERNERKDHSSVSVVRDPNKCINCGNCVRMCEEVQAVGALGISHRGSKSRVGTPFGKDLADVKCVGCGQCYKVCPVGAITINQQVNEVWKAVLDKETKVVIQIAPAVRTAIGEHFGKQPGEVHVERVVTALRRVGFDQVYDTTFGADLTIMEEAKEFLARKKAGENLPLFTSCCPAWVKFTEYNYPEFFNNLSSCRSPQQMFGSLCKDHLTKELGVPREKLVVVSIMPCTAKKFEAGRDEFKVNGNPDVDYVITTEELALMIKDSGIDFDKLEPGTFDDPFGDATGAGVIFGASGGVSEAVLRFAANALDKNPEKDYSQLRSKDGVKVTEVTVGGITLKLAIVSGLANARDLLEKIKNKEVYYDIVEVMACSGGCVNGGGQPITIDGTAVSKRTQGLYDNDISMKLHVSSDNPSVQKFYSEDLKDDAKAHKLLHTHYENKAQIVREDFVLAESDSNMVSLKFCFGSSCFKNGAQALYLGAMDYIAENKLEDLVGIKGNFCEKSCERGPVVVLNGKSIEHCTIDILKAELQKALKK